MAGKKNSRYIGHLTWEEVEKLNESNMLLLIPVGAIEQHGHHLPIETDTRIGFEILKESVDNLPSNINAYYTLPIWTGYSEHHEGFPGLLSIKGDTLKQIVIDLCTRADKEGFKNIVLFNSHGGNELFLSAAARILYDDFGIKVGVLTYWNLIKNEISKYRESELGGINHACELETSLMLYIEENLVSKEKIHDNVLKKGKYNRVDLLDSGVVFAGGKFKEISKTGVVGMPSLASKEKGEKIFKAAANKLQEFIEDYIGN